MKSPDRNRRSDERGIALLYVAIFLLVSLWFVSLAIDVGKLTAARTELQAAADAAALAGASAIDMNTLELNKTLSKTRAAEIAASNSAYENVKTSIVIDPDADVTFPGVRKVTVSVYRDSTHGTPVMLHFAQTLGLRWMGVRAKATAEVAPLSTLCGAIAPFAPEEPDTGGFSKACGTSYTLKLGAGNSTSGNFQLLDYPDSCLAPGVTGGGGAAIRYYIVNGFKCCLEIGSLVEVNTEPGNVVGPVRQGLQARWDADTDTRPDICYQDYRGNGSRVFLCPIIANFAVNGKKEVQILKFAAFFLLERPGGNLVSGGVKGQFIDYVSVGTADSSIPPDSTSVFGVHLIKTEY
jgi:Flp pilus assembly protein TadG